MTTNHIDREEEPRPHCRGFYPDLRTNGEAHYWNSEPAPSTVETAAPDKEQDNYYDEKCGGIHDSLQAETNRGLSAAGGFYAVRKTPRKREWFLRCS